MRDHSLYVVMIADEAGQPIEHRMVVQPDADAPPSGDYIGTGDPAPRLPMRPAQTIVWPILRHAPRSACDAIARGRAAAWSDRATEKTHPAPAVADAAVLLTMAIAEEPRESLRAWLEIDMRDGADPTKPCTTEEDREIDIALWRSIEQHPKEHLEAAKTSVDNSEAWWATIRRRLGDE